MLDHPPTRAGSPLSYRYRPSKGRRGARESRELGSVTSELVKQNTHSKAKTKTLPCIFKLSFWPRTDAGTLSISQGYQKKNT